MQPAELLPETHAPPKVQCCMPKSFLREYLMADANAVPCPRDVAPTAWASALFRYRKRLWTLNPWKLVACKHLLHIHTMRKDKVRCLICLVSAVAAAAHTHR